MFCPTWISHHISGFVFDAILLWEILAEETNDSIQFVAYCDAQVFLINTEPWIYRIASIWKVETDIIANISSSLIEWAGILSVLSANWTFSLWGVPVIKVWITELTLIHKNIRSVHNSHAQFYRLFWRKTHYDITDKNNNVEMWWEIHVGQNISTMVCLSRICKDNVINIDITSCI
jgi:hypothetical protein